MFQYIQEMYKKACLLPSQTANLLTSIPQIFHAYNHLIDALSFTPASIATACKDSEGLKLFLLFYTYPDTDRKKVFYPPESNEFTYLAEYWSLFSRIIHYAIDMDLNDAPQAVPSAFKYAAGQKYFTKYINEIEPHMLKTIITLTEECAEQYCKKNVIDAFSDLLFSSNDRENIETLKVTHDLFLSSITTSEEKTHNKLFFIAYLLLHSHAIHAKLILALTPKDSDENTSNSARYVFLKHWIDEHFPSSPQTTEHNHYHVIIQFLKAFNARYTKKPDTLMLCVLQAYLDTAFTMPSPCNDAFKSIRQHMEKATGDEDEKIIMLIILSLMPQRPMTPARGKSAFDIFTSYAHIRDVQAMRKVLQICVHTLCPEKAREDIITHIEKLLHKKGLFRRSNYGTALKSSIQSIWLRLKNNLRNKTLDQASTYQYYLHAHTLHRALAAYQAQWSPSKKALTMALNTLRETIESPVQHNPTPEITAKNILHYLLEPHDILPDKVLKFIGIEKTLICAAVFFVIALLVMITTQLYIAQMLTLTSYLTIIAAGIGSLAVTLGVGFILWRYVLPQCIPSLCVIPTPISSSNIQAHTREAENLSSHQASTMHLGTSYGR